MELERGRGYSIDLYYVVSENGCTKIAATDGLGKTFGSNKVYRVAHQTGLDFNSTQVTVELHIQWPNQSNTLATLHSLPLSCKKGEDPMDKMALREAGLVMGAAHGTTTGNHFMRVRIKDQSLDPEIENWSGRILPARLGDDQ